MSNIHKSPRFQLQLWHIMTAIAAIGLVLGLLSQVQSAGLHGDIARLILALAIASPLPLVYANRAAHKGGSASLGGLIGGAISGFFWFLVVSVASLPTAIQSMNGGYAQLVQVVVFVIVIGMVICNAIWGFVVGLVVRMAVGVDYCPEVGVNESRLS